MKGLACELSGKVCCMVSTAQTLLFFDGHVTLRYVEMVCTTRGDTRLRHAINAAAATIALLSLMPRHTPPATAMK